MSAEALLTQSYVAVRTAEDSVSRGVFAVRDIPAGAVLLSVPLDSVFTDPGVRCLLPTRPVIAHVCG